MLRVPADSVPDETAVVPAFPPGFPAGSLVEVSPLPTEHAGRLQLRRSFASARQHLTAPSLWAAHMWPRNPTSARRCAKKKSASMRRCKTTPALIRNQTYPDLGAWLFCHDGAETPASA